MKQPWKKRDLLVWVGSFLLALIVVTQAGWIDSLADRLFTPRSPEIARLAQLSQMTPSAQRLFYRQLPTIESKQTFLEQCQVPDQAIMLGCYHKGKIIIQDVTDPRLKGTMEVTAAHEMLHAAYARLSKQDIQDLAPRLTRASNRVKDQRLKSVLDDYKLKDTQLYHNELHSHLGTELADLGDPTLETYYQRYFIDRRQVTALAQRSSAILTQLDQQADQLKPEIQQLEAELTDLEERIKQAETELASSHRELDQLDGELQSAKITAESAIQQGATDSYSRVNQFEQQKVYYNQRVGQHNDRAEIQRNRITRFNEKLTDYKAKIKTYNQIARESHNILDSLANPNQSIDQTINDALKSKSTPAPKP
jgi:chromosome segregation ATPase